MHAFSNVSLSVASAARPAAMDLEKSVAALLIATQMLSRLPPLTKALAERLIRNRVVIQDDAGLWKLARQAA